MLQFPFSAFDDVELNLGFVGCIESLKIENTELSQDYDLMYPGSKDIVGGSSISKKSLNKRFMYYMYYVLCTL